MVPLSPQEITRAGLDGEPTGDETWVRVQFSTMWYWPGKAKGPSDNETTSWRMIELVMRGVQFYHVDAPHHADGFSGRMPSGEEFELQSPSNGVVLIPWPLHYVSARGTYDGPEGAPGRPGHRFLPFVDFHHDIVTPL